MSERLGITAQKPTLTGRRRNAINHHEDEIAAGFAALSARAKIMVLARMIHMDTVHVRSAHLDDPIDFETLYQSSEFTHRLSGCIMSIATEPAEATPDDYIASLLMEGVKPRGGQYLRMLADWVGEAETFR